MVMKLMLCPFLLHYKFCNASQITAISTHFREAFHGFDL
jgi:hypothetical protein